MSLAVTVFVKLAILSCFFSSTTADLCNIGECRITAGISSGNDHVLCNRPGSLPEFPTFKNCAEEIQSFTVL